MFKFFQVLVLMVLALSVASLPQPKSAVAKRSTPKLVFAHYMLITRPPNGDYTNDIQLAKAAGIDAFAINYGGWNVDWNQQEGYLAKFYADAEANGYSVFLSIDTTSVTDINMIIGLVNQYANSPAQLKINGEIMLSTFTGAPVAWNWTTDVIDKIASPVLFIPGSCGEDPSTLFSPTVGGKGPFPWIHPANTFEVEHDLLDAYAAKQQSTGKVWIASIAPWFFKRFGTDTNWSHAQDENIFLNRWLHLLDLQPDYIEIVTWNDYGESTYIGPLDTVDQFCYWADLDHSAFLKITTKFIKHYKAGQDSSSLTIDPSEEDVFFFYRLQPALTLGTTDTLPLPSNASMLKDDVFVVTMLASPAQISMQSGNSPPNTWTAPAGVSRVWPIPWQLGNQTLTASRNGKVFVNKTGPAVVSQLDRYNGNVVAL